MSEELNSEKEKIPNTEKIELKNKILDLAMADWGNEFINITTKLQGLTLTKDIKILLNSKREKINIKNLWERYNDFKEDDVLELESEHKELKEMREAIEEGQRILDKVYDFLEECKDKNSENFLIKVNEFFNEAKAEWNKFEKNRNALREKYGRLK